MSVVAGVEPVVMASQTLESGPFYRDEMSKLLNKSEHWQGIYKGPRSLESGPFCCAEMG